MNRNYPSKGAKKAVEKKLSQLPSGGQFQSAKPPSMGKVQFLLPRAFLKSEK
jgi:hypothetical protein